MALISFINESAGVFKQRAVVSILSAQPTSPTIGDYYILGSSPTGAIWGSYRENELVLWDGSSWAKQSPAYPTVVFIESYNSLYYFDGTAWRAL